ncbi:MAG: UMP kinase [Methanoregulaceae archaeon]|nr:UMP kinase [Methanoregulaceae archaeon]
MKKTLVLSLGGSVLIPSLEENRIGAYVPVLTKIAAAHRLFVVVGGGGEARRFIAAARNLGADDGTADEIGIAVTRLNARLLIAGLRGAVHPALALSQDEAIAKGESGKIVVMGGITPGQTTDAVSAVLAERLGADLLINLTSVDGVYSADPKTDPEAKRYDRLSPVDLLGIVRLDLLTAGANSVMDMVAANVVARSGVPLVVMDGRDPANLEKAVFSGTFRGTVVDRENRKVLPL